MRLWDIRTGDEIQQFSGHAARVYAVEFAPDDRLLLSASEDATARLWDVTTGEQVDRMITSSAIQGIAFSHDGSLFATAGSRNRLLRIWDTTTGELEDQIVGIQNGIGFVDISPDSQYLVSGSVGNIVHLWELEEISEPRAFTLPLSTQHEEAVQLAHLTPDHENILTIYGGGVYQIWNVASQSVTYELSLGTDAFVSDAAIALADNLMLLTTDAGRIMLWDLENETQIRNYHGLENIINALDFNPESGIFVTAGEDSQMWVWKLESAEPVHTLVGHSGPVNDVALSIDSQIIATADNDGKVRVWRLEKGTQIRDLTGHNGSVLSVDISNNGRWVLLVGKIIMLCYGILKPATLVSDTSDIHSVCVPSYSQMMTSILPLVAKI